MSKYKLIEKGPACLGNVSSPVEQVRFFHLTVCSTEAAFHKVTPGEQGFCLSCSLQCVLGLEQNLVSGWFLVDKVISFVTSGTLSFSFLLRVMGILPSTLRSVE